MGLLNLSPITLYIFNYKKLNYIDGINILLWLKKDGSIILSSLSFPPQYLLNCYITKEKKNLLIHFFYEIILA